MSFSDIFWPIFCALCGWSAVLEVINLTARWWIAKRSKTLYGSELGHPELQIMDFDPQTLANIYGQSQQISTTTSSGTEHHGSGHYL